MILDARKLDSKDPLEFDVCIVGAGPAGITVALELERSGARVCVLESGGFGYGRRTQALYGGEGIDESYLPLRDTRLAAFGGSTKIWGGWCRPLDEIDFERRPWVADSGWPFERGTLEPFYHRAHELCGLGDFEYDPTVWERRGAGQPLPVTDHGLTTSMFHVTPIGFGEAYRSVLQRASGVTVLLHAIALRLHVSPASEAVESVDVATLSGRRFAVKARLFALAAGGLENARLLMLSGDSPATSVGNASGLVGKFFTEHAFVDPGTFVPSRPLPSLGFYFPSHLPSLPAGTAVRAAFSLGRSTLERERLLNCALFFRPAYEADPVYASEGVKAMLELWDKLRGRGVPGHTMIGLRRSVRAPHRLAVAIWRRLTVRGTIRSRWRLKAFFECESRECNRVRLSNQRDALGRPLPQVEWQLSELDLQSIRRGCELFARAVRKAGLGRVELAFRDEADAWRAACQGLSHHMGTTRMHTDPRRGIVDANARVHGAKNLYVAGSSIFPTAGFANPTLTIVALAARLAKHLQSRL